MIAAPAVDLRGGRCVQLVGGRPEEEKVSLPDPVARAAAWWEKGFRTLHIVDLDAALSDGHNRGAIRDIVAATQATIQVGGGVRDTEAVGEILDLGAARVIVGTRAIDDPQWLETTANAYPERILVATDVREGMVLKKGWTESSGIPLQDLLDRLERHPLAGVLCTDVSREGKMEGIDLAGAASVIGGTRHPVWISGGITTMQELRALEGAGAAGAVLGMALYTGVISPDQAAEEFGA
jgi:phosphoribosylformimino-5-aminoimidazole carboxamide ribotide isomerase